MMNQVVILAGGHGNRMKVAIPKPMLSVLDVPMLGWVIRACESTGLSRICVVTGYKAKMVEIYLGNRCRTVLQEEQLGTGHAVMQAEGFLKEFDDGNTLVLCGDAPFMDSETISNALKFHIQQENAVTVVTADLDNPTGYGRILRRGSGIAAIVEEKDATEAQRKVREVNSGAYWFQTKALLELLSGLSQSNAQGEYYLTDTVGLALEKGWTAGAYRAENPDVVLGANTRKDLLHLNEVARQRVLEWHMDNGISFVCTDGVIIGNKVEIGAETTILPGTILRGKTKIGNHCTIGPNCILENCTIGDHVTLNSVQAYDAVVEDAVKAGPFVHLRPGTHLKNGVKIGDFVEVKNSTVGEQTAIAHLTYVGDSDVGKKVNFGCGTVTVNYDGMVKNRCEIGDGCFIGCNTNLIAPVKLGKGAYTAAGSTVTKDVPEYALAVERADLKLKEDYSKKKLRNRLFPGDDE
ncbi:MAG: bifunctional UDP-N-acetylglucosamine diphosphorylase/glucosamine-1-phosphate N-acetyltransferase GlmU [Ruminococcus sp.]|nr:bifunctional UDP-N-acetylglucosamine diphosphorylase/glucosamine-1-phosphate N-acetyltransferase GlmU [Ruminococcus sp.]